MANPPDMATLQKDVTEISNANWSWKALTPEAKVIGRTWYGLVLQWLPKSFIFNIFKRSIHNTDVDAAIPKVKEKIVTLLVNMPKLNDTCEKAITSMNVLIDRINKTRDEHNKLPQLDMAALKVKAEAQTAPEEPKPASPKQETPSRSPGRGRRTSRGESSAAEQPPAAPSLSPILPTPPILRVSPNRAKPAAAQRTSEQPQGEAAADTTTLASPPSSITSPNQTIRSEARNSPANPAEQRVQLPRPPKERNPIVSPDHQSMTSLYRSPEQPQPAAPAGSTNAAVTPRRSRRLSGKKP